MKKRNLKGFLLIELLIALGIMSILAFATFITIGPQISKARDAKVKEDLIQIRNALTAYNDDNKGCFPDSLPACGQAFEKNNVTYFSKIPCNPNGKDYEYETDNNSCHTWFKLLANLENTKDKSIDDVGCRFGCGNQCAYNYGTSSTNVSLDQGCVKYYACSPSGSCIAYSNPEQSQCPATFKNDPTCQNMCDKKSYKCHDESGKQN